MSGGVESSVINASIERVPADLVDKARGYASSILADSAGRRGGMSGRIRAMTAAARFAGPAVTVEVRPGDNLLIHAAMAIVRPGDVLVIDGKGDLSSALMGAIMMSACKRLGVAGVVIDGAIRDVDELDDIGVPVFACGANPNGPTKACPGRINAPIACGEIAVRPGDLLVADADGVTVIERLSAAGVLEAAAKKIEEERQILAAISAPAPGPYQWKPGWLDGALRSANAIKADQSISQFLVH